jgi:hypothetical protein
MNTDIIIDDDTNNDEIQGHCCNSVIDGRYGNWVSVTLVLLIYEIKKR